VQTRFTWRDNQEHKTAEGKIKGGGVTYPFLQHNHITQQENKERRWERRKRNFGQDNGRLANSNKEDTHTHTYTRSNVRIATRYTQKGKARRSDQRQKTTNQNTNDNTTHLFFTVRQKKRMKLIQNKDDKTRSTMNHLLLPLLPARATVVDHVWAPSSNSLYPKSSSWSSKA
jgi:hypothetical protein